MKLYTRIQARINGIQNEDGATAVEYALMASLIALVIFGAVGALGVALNSLFENLRDEL